MRPTCCPLLALTLALAPVALTACGGADAPTPIAGDPTRWTVPVDDPPSDAAKATAEGYRQAFAAGVEQPMGTPLTTADDEGSHDRLTATYRDASVLRWLEQNRDALRQARALSQREDCRYVDVLRLDFSPSHLSQHLQLVYWLAVSGRAAVVDQQADRQADGVADWAAGLRVARHLGRDPMLLAHLAEQTGVRHVLQQIDHALRERELRPPALEALIEALRANAATARPFDDFVEAERVLTRQAGEEALEVGLDPHADGAKGVVEQLAQAGKVEPAVIRAEWNQLYPAYADPLFDRLVAAARREGYREQTAAFDAVLKDIALTDEQAQAAATRLAAIGAGQAEADAATHARLRTEVLQTTARMVVHMMVAWTRKATEVRADQTKLRLTLAACRLELAHARDGVYPETLTLEAPHGLDPFADDDAMLGYVRLADGKGYRLSSVGPEVDGARRPIVRERQPR